jgi:hypothetical protein
VWARRTEECCFWKGCSRPTGTQVSLSVNRFIALGFLSATSAAQSTAQPPSIPTIKDKSTNKCIRGAKWGEGVPHFHSCNG